MFTLKPTNSPPPLNLSLSFSLPLLPLSLSFSHDTQYNLRQTKTTTICYSTGIEKQRQIDRKRERERERERKRESERDRERERERQKEGKFGDQSNFGSKSREKIMKPLFHTPPYFSLSLLDSSISLTHSLSPSLFSFFSLLKSSRKTRAKNDNTLSQSLFLYPYHSLSPYFLSLLLPTLSLLR